MKQLQLSDNETLINGINLILKEIGIESKKYKIIKDILKATQTLRITSGTYEKNKKAIDQFEEFLQQSGGLWPIKSHEKDLFEFALKNSKIFGIPFEKLGVQIVERHNDKGKEEYVISTVFNSSIIIKEMKAFLSENEGCITSKFNVDNAIINNIGEKLFKTNVWNKCIKQFSLESSEDYNLIDKNNCHSTVLFCSCKEGGFEITTREFLVKRYIELIQQFFRQTIIYSFTYEDLLKCSIEFSDLSVVLSSEELNTDAFLSQYSIITKNIELRDENSISMIQKVFVLKYLLENERRPETISAADLNQIRDTQQGKEEMIKNALSKFCIKQSNIIDYK